MLAHQTSLALARELGQVAAFSYRQLFARLSVTRHYFGSGYGRPTRSGQKAIATMTAAGGPPLDLVYSAKSGAALFDLERAGAHGPLLFWTTKSSAPLPRPSPAQLAAADPALRDWLAAENCHLAQPSFWTPP
jgi:hypothetical protein